LTIAALSRQGCSLKGLLSPEQTAQIAAAKQVIYDGFKAAVAAGVAKERAGILVDEQFGSAIYRMRLSMATILQPPRRRVGRTSSTSSMATTSRGTSRHST